MSNNLQFDEKKLEINYSVTECPEMERMPCNEFCSRKWQHIKEATKSDRSALMIECLSTCEFVKSFADWHNKN